METNRTLKRNTESKTETLSSLNKMVSNCVSELMNASTSFHKLHLKVTGVGSFSAHKALNELYDALPGHADTLAEQFQGAAEILLDYSDSAPKSLNSIQEAIMYSRELSNKITSLQEKMPYSEIVNELDTFKSTINSIKYKLLFLK